MTRSRINLLIMICSSCEVLAAEALNKAVDAARKVVAVTAGEMKMTDDAKDKMKSVVDPEKIESIVATPLAAVVAAAREVRQARERAGSPVTSSRRSKSPSQYDHNDASRTLPSSPWISDKRVNATMDQAFLISPHIVE